MRRSILAGFCLLVACSKAPQAPTSPPPSTAPVALAQFSGLWSGAFRIATCEGERHCVLFRGSSRPFELRLKQSGASVRGVFNGNQSITDVTGTVLNDGTLTLSGADPGASSGGGGVTARVELRFSPEGALQGTVWYETRPLAQNAEFSSTVVLGGDVISAERSDLASFVTDVTGAWTGSFVVRTCMPRGIYCHPLRDQEVELVEMTLSASGSAITGTCTVGGSAMRIPLSGTVSGSTIRLSGEITVPPAGGGPLLLRVSDWAGTIDEFGRMKGSFTYEFAYPSGSPTLGESAVLELWQVVKRR